MAEHPHKTSQDLNKANVYSSAVSSGTTVNGNNSNVLTNLRGKDQFTSTTGTGIGIETRPVNLGVNYFVKINHECN